MGLKCLLASMDGMSHAAFRSVCFDYGADGATTEMIPAVSYARVKKKRIAPILEALLLRAGNEHNVAAQIIGHDPEDMAMAAARLGALQRFDAIEINMAVLRGRLSAVATVLRFYRMSASQSASSTLSALP